ncbi:Peptidyl-prolyl cis-trans isomerase, chloroplastic [Cymbomonas tetramitiformis]|uniref:peptidylprolyl isomerase n=1 Tax=Cymbomonas tetramitiformis TaxID=36881 RepID=A0AAE0LFZ5_9CHLO|nr:Peptidyl-prolyl cis-trans isomerase, chloroplastic [Cymbomonas tetramitiformis]
MLLQSRSIQNRAAVHSQGSTLRGQVVRADTDHGRLSLNRGLKVNCSQDTPREALAKAARNAACGLACAAAFLGPVNETLAAVQQAYPDVAMLTAGDPVKNANALLRYALPIDNKEIRTIQRNLEGISEDLRVPGVKFSGVSKAVNTSLKIASKQQNKILASVPDQNKDDAKLLLKDLVAGLEDFQVIVSNKDVQEVPIQQQAMLDLVGQIEEDMLSGYPFEVPAQYASMPLLKGRATVEVNLRLVENPTIDKAQMTIVLDGLNAPVTAGNFVDLVQRKFYNNMEVQRADGFVVQTGDPEGPAVGFVDPKTNKVRTIPLEVYVPGDDAPVYEETLEEMGRYNAIPALPFNAYGTMAMARSEFENNSGSSQVFWLLKESELTPSSANLLDGRYAVFGYVTEGVDILEVLKVGDMIESIKVTKGIENLVNPSYEE